MEERLRRFLVRDDAEYDRLVKQYQAQTIAGKFFYLFMHLLPGLLAYSTHCVDPVRKLSSSVSWYCHASIGKEIRSCWIDVSLVCVQKVHDAKLPRT